MGELFRNKARVDGLIIYFDERDEIYSDTFKLWCVKLKDLTIENFRDGTIAMERKAEMLFSKGEEMWPPSYAEFRALAFPKKFDSLAHKPLESDYDPTTGTYRLEDQTAKAERCELGMKNTSALLARLNEPSPEQADSEKVNTYGQEQLAKAKAILEARS